MLRTLLEDVTVCAIKRKVPYHDDVWCLAKGLSRRIALKYITKCMEIIYGCSSGLILKRCASSEFLNEMRRLAIRDLRLFMAVKLKLKCEGRCLLFAI